LTNRSYKVLQIDKFFIFNVSYMPTISSSILQWELIGSWSPFVVIGNLKMITDLCFKFG